MNERIKDLLDRSTKEVWDNNEYNGAPEFEGYEVDQEKFAELIVRECAQVANDSNHSKNRAVGVSVGDVIRTYFGVEE